MPEELSVTERIKLPQSISGCTRAGANTSTIHKDKIYYISGRSIMCSNREQYNILFITSKITAISIGDNGLICAGSMIGEVCAMIDKDIDKDKEWTSISKENTEIISVKITNEFIFYTTRETINIYSMEEKNIIYTEKILETIIDIDISSKKIDNNLLFIFCGTYSGKILVYKLMHIQAENKYTLQEAARTSLCVSEICTISIVEKKDIIKIAAGFLSGKIGIFEYKINGFLRKKEILPAYRERCTSARWADKEGKKILASSEDGTATLWAYNTHWECIRRVGNIGSASVINCMLDSGNDIILHRSKGGIYRTSSLQPIISGHTSAINSIEVFQGKMILTASEDKTVRVFKFQNGDLSEVFRPVVGGYPIKSAAYFNSSTIAVACEENVLRIYKATALYNHIIGDNILGDNIPGINGIDEIDSPENIPFTAQTHELSLTNTPYTPRKEKQEEILTGPLTDTELSNNPFYEVYKTYGFPFEIEDMKCIENKLVLVSCRASQKEFASLFVLNTRFEIVQTLQVHTRTIKRIIISPKKKIVATFGRDRRVSIFEVLSGRSNFSETEVLPGFTETDKGLKLLDSRVDHTREILSATFSADEAYLFTSSKDKTLIEYSISDKTLKFISKKNISSYAYSLAFNNTSLLMGTEKGSVLFKDSSYSLHNSPITHLKVSEIEGNLCLISGTSDGILRVDKLDW